MERIILVVFVTIFSARIVSSWSDVDVSCCPPGHVLIETDDEKQYCQNPVDENNSTISLICPTKIFVYAEDEESTFVIGSSKELTIVFDNWNLEFEPNVFCMANQSVEETDEITNKTTRIIQRAATLCIDDEEVRYIDEETFGYCMIVSVIFLAITAIIYMSFPELRDLQGKSIINLCISLGLGLGILAIMKLISYSDMELCAARGFLAYFFVMASFFWTNAISIQILLNMRRPTTVTYGWKEFIWYAAYAWGLSATLTSVMAVVNFTPGNHFKPGIGLNHCWFFDDTQQWWYMYSGMTIVILVNTCIFIHTSILLWRQSFSSSNVKALKFKFTMTVRLFVVMGLAWIFEMIGTLVENHIVFEILDVINAMQGVLIFLVLVVFRRRVVKAMYQNGWLGWISGPVERCLAVGEDEEDVIQHTIGIPMDEKADIF